MKKEINATMLAKLQSIVTSMSEVTVVNASVGGNILPVGKNFQLVCVGNVANTDRLPAYQAVIIEFCDNGIQMPLSFNTLKGVKRVLAFDPDKKPFNRIEITETHFTKSGKNIIDYINDNADTVFTVTGAESYKTVLYGTERIVDKSLPIIEVINDSAPEKTKK